MADRGRYVVIPTHNRPAELLDLLTVLVTKVDLIFVIDNASSPPLWGNELRKELRDRLGDAMPPGRLCVIRDSEQPPNLTRLWTVGLRAAAEDASWEELTEWDVAILNDDLVMYPEWFDMCSNTMRVTGASGASTAPHIDQPLVLTVADGNIGQRMYGPAFMVRGELATREGDPIWPDIQFRWWFGDTDWDWTIRRNGGLVRVPGPYVPNLYENHAMNANPVLMEQAGRDRESFRLKHGWCPW